MTDKTIQFLRSVGFIQATLERNVWITPKTTQSIVFHQEIDNLTDLFEYIRNDAFWKGHAVGHKNAETDIENNFRKFIIEGGQNAE